MAREHLAQIIQLFWTDADRDMKDMSQSFFWSAPLVADRKLLFAEGTSARHQHFHVPAMIFRSVVFTLSVLVFLPSSFSEEAPHADIIRHWNTESLARGKQLYETLCITCHGTPEREGTLPTSRPFWKEPFKNGNDPFSLYKTLSQGLGQMPAWTFLTPEQRYDAIQYV